MITATELRNNLYNKLDSVITTGIPLEIMRKGRIVKIISDDRDSSSEHLIKARGKSKWSRLIPHPDCIIGNPDDLEKINWSDYGVF